MNRQKSAARLYALQALFQMEASEQSLQDVSAQFLAHRFGAVIEDAHYCKGDRQHFEALLQGVIHHQTAIDGLTEQALKHDWPMARIDPVLRALFRAAGAEMILCKTPKKVLINEFVDLARAFFPDGKEIKFVNAVLDTMYHAQTLSQEQSG